jgi:hypothetical protein
MKRTPFLVLLLTLATPSAIADSQSWPLDDAVELDFDPSLVMVADGAASLIPSLTGTGTDGDLILSSESFDLSSDASGSRGFADGAAWTISDILGAGSTSLELDAYSGGLAPGDELLLLTVQGTPTSTTGVGSWETVRISEISGTTLETTALSNSYDGAGHQVMAQRVPNYADVSLVDATITTRAWDGSTGGVVAFRASGGVSIDADSSVEVSGLGFLGGPGGSASGGGGEGGGSWLGVDGPGGDVSADGTGAGGGGQGRGSATKTQGGPGGYGAGGGGADGTVNSDDGAGGGGGGGHAGGGGGGGGGTGCGGSVAGDGGYGGDAGEGGGGGGGSSCPGGDGGDAGAAGVIGSHCYDGSAQAGHAGSGTASGGGGDSCASPYGGGGGGGGGATGEASLASIFFGGGGAGGGGSSYGIAGGDGGDGGGIVMIFAASIGLEGSIGADGLEGETTTTSYRSASGGSGAGGSIYLAADSIDLSGSLSAAGGAPVVSGSHIAGGGGGGDGRIRIDADSINGLAWDDGAVEAELASVASPAPGWVQASDTSYPTEATVCSVDPVVPAYSSFVWTGFTASESPDGGSIAYVLGDDGASWWWYDSGWSAASSSAEANSASALDAAIPSRSDSQLYWCAWLLGDGSQAVSLEAVDISYAQDSDGDGIADGDDNCPGAANPGQEDSDTDGIGDACDDCTDADGDGYGDPDIGASGCDEDCDDSDASINPAASETWYDGIDSDCDGASDYDADGDGHDHSAYGGGDCDDGDAAVSPAATELCNGIDDDCDGSVDEDDADDASTWYADSDGDGFGDTASTTAACVQPSGFVADHSDCDDGEAAVNPSATELCNGIDDDCDGSVDEDDADDASTWYTDSDGDGFGDPASGTVSCAQPAGTVADSSDCDDGDMAVSPAATELCNGLDDDCDGTIDESDAADASTWYADSDGDGFADPGSSVTACDQPSGHLAPAHASDCDDSDAAVYPGAEDSWYDGIDSDCDGASDYDQDADGFDHSAYGGDDCDDEDEAVNPEAKERWYDGVDQDCDGASDYDADADGYDSESHGGDDCDDGNPETYPGAPDEPYDGVINDCDSASDYDADGDGFDALAYGGEDCDDHNSGANPDATEIWYDGIDQDCDGNDDDQDGDGWALDDDCDDTDPESYPGAEGLDEDCEPIDTGEPADSGDSGEPPEDSGLRPWDSGGLSYKGGGGCTGCAGSSRAPSPWLLLLLTPLLVGRRRG